MNPKHIFSPCLKEKIIKLSIYVHWRCQMSIGDAKCPMAVSNGDGLEYDFCLQELLLECELILFLAPPHPPCLELQLFSSWLYAEQSPIVLPRETYHLPPKTKAWMLYSIRTP